MNQSCAAAQHPLSTAPSASAISALLLALYDAARQPSVQQFQADAVQALRRHVVFDSVLWGTGTRVDGRSHTHCAYVWNMPGDAVHILNLTERQNVVARRCGGQPGVAHAFDAVALQATDETAMLAAYQGIRQVCCIASIDEGASLVSFLSIARQHDEPAFDDGDRAWLELLMPHLDAMLNLTRVAQMVQIREARASSHVRMAVTDVKGILHVMEPGFDQLLREEWPGWQGPLLPAALLGAGPGQPRRYNGRNVTGECAGAAEQLLITLARKGPADRLTAQERAVAMAYAGGRSYKEVAQQLGLAPATVRHHLREVYAKLCVDDKAKLSALLAP